MSGVDAVILVGGKGTRLRPLTLAVPKPLLPTAGLPFLTHLLSRIAEAGRPGSEVEQVEEEEVEEFEEEGRAMSARRRLSEMTSPVRRSRAWVFFGFRFFNSGIC